MSAFMNGVDKIFIFVAAGTFSGNHVDHFFQFNHK